MSPISMLHTIRTLFSYNIVVSRACAATTKINAECLLFLTTGMLVKKIFLKHFCIVYSLKKFEKSVVASILAFLF